MKTQVLCCITMLSGVRYLCYALQADVLKLKDIISNFIVKKNLSVSFISISLTEPVDQLELKIDGKIYTTESSPFDCEQSGGHFAAINYVEVIRKDGQMIILLL